MKTLRILAVLLPSLMAGCGGNGDRFRQPDPVSPSPVDATAVSPGDAGHAGAQTNDIGIGAVSVPSPPEGGAVTNIITFPSRAETLLWGLVLESLYRDTFGRSPTLTFVDLEGAVVWIQEYLRYRLNGCGHLDAVTRVFLQIEGFGIQPVCSIFEFPFPPRNEAFDFYLRLELEYQNFLRRTQMPTYTDGEGKLVWIQEYLRYRVSGCSHSEASQKVIDQILGRGVQPDCRSRGLRFTGTVEAFGFQGHSFSVADTGRMTATLTWPDASIDLDLYLTSASCTGYPPANCTLLAVSNAVGTNVEQVSRNVFSGEQYTVWVDSFSLTRSSTYQIDVVLVGSLLSHGSPSLVQVVESLGGRKPPGTGKVH